MHVPEQVGLYSDPLIYDVLHTPGTAEEVDALIRLERAWSLCPGTRRLWLEPAAGSGRYLRIARARGIDCIGFDHDPDMVRYSENRARRARSNASERYFVGSMTDFADLVPPSSVTFAFNLINTIRHLETDVDMLAHFEQISRVLAPGACYCIGMSISLYGHEQPSEDVWHGARASCSVDQVVQFIPPTTGRWERVVSHLTITRPEGEEVRESSYRLRTYSLEEWTGLIDRSALRLAGSADIDGMSLPPPRMGYAHFMLTRQD